MFAGIKSLFLIATFGSLFALMGCASSNHERHYNTSHNKSNPGREWDRGCKDAKHNRYDSDDHPEAYKDGHRSCKDLEGSSRSSVVSEKERGCNDAKRGYYDQDRHPKAYKEGHRACK